MPFETILAALLALVRLNFTSPSQLLLLLLIPSFLPNSPFPSNTQNCERAAASPISESLKAENSGGVPTLSTRMAPSRSSSSLFLTAVAAAALLLFSAAAPLRAGASAFPEALDAGDAYFSDEALAHLSESLTKCERRGEREDCFFFFSLLCFSLVVCFLLLPPQLSLTFFFPPRPSKKIKKIKIK